MTAKRVGHAKNTKTTAKRTRSARDRNGAVIKHEPPDRPPAAFRGLMPTPPEVQALMDKLYRNVKITDSFRRHQTDLFNEQFHFGGYPIAYRDTPQGREVLAVGWDELNEL